MLKRSMIIARKEMREAFRSRVIKYSFVGMGLLFGFVIPMLYGFLGELVGISSGGGTSGMPIPPDFFPGFTLGQRTYLFFLYAFLAEMLLMVPVILPVYIAADSFAGEKERKTIQQLLETPLTDSEILLGKILTSFIPTIITTYACILSTTIVVNLSWYFVNGAFQLIFPNITVLIQLALLYPLLAFFGILTMVWVSTRATKVMEATQLGGVVVVPVLVIAFLPILVGAITSIYFVLTVVAIFAVADYGLFKVASRKFTRDAILQRL
ncbi:MAG: ABC transporter permease subunit [Promethearchaeati archaeon SRVP18_Atabeyarchaeia-1]